MNYLHKFNSSLGVCYQKKTACLTQTIFSISSFSCEMSNFSWFLRHFIWLILWWYLKNWLVQEIILLYFSAYRVFQKQSVLLSIFLKEEVQIHLVLRSFITLRYFYYSQGTPDVGNSLTCPLGQEWGPHFPFGPTSFIYFASIDLGIPLPMYYWEYLFNFGLNVLFQGQPHVTMSENHPCVLKQSNLALGPDEPWVCVGSRLLQSHSFCLIYRTLETPFPSSSFELKRLQGKGETSKVSSLPTALRGTNNWPLPFPNWACWYLHSIQGCSWALLPPSLPNPNSRYCLSCFFQLEYSCFTMLCTLCCTAAWLSHIFIYIPFILAPSSQSTGAEFPEPHRRFLIVSLFYT